MARAQVQTNSKQEERELSETWYGVTDPSARRKLQNRLNQRASRKRKAEADGNVGLVIKQWTTTQSRSKKLPSRPQNQSISTKVSEDQDSSDSENRSTSPESTSSSEPWSHPMKTTVTDLEIRAVEFARSSWQILLPTPSRKGQPPNFADVDCWANKGLSLPADNLLSLIYYNVFRALTFNVEVLGLNEKQICQDIYPSPFLPMSPTASSALSRLPHRMKPTKLQASAYHHAWTDVYPDPVVRDNIIKKGEGTFDDEELCTDFIGLTGLNEYADHFLVLDEGPRTGVTVWGDPWELESWEISEALAKKWPWVFKGAHELEAWTNFRRTSRGWKTISFA